MWLKLELFFFVLVVVIGCRLNENMIETLFVSNGTGAAQKEGSKRPGLQSFQQEDKVLDPKKSQNIAILLRALNVNQQEVTEALLDGELAGTSKLICDKFGWIICKIDLRCFTLN